MAYIDLKELLNSAKEYFIEGNYAKAEPLLQEALLKNGSNPEIYQMLATIAYDRGQFNRAIKTFKKALEIDPFYTDASVGLSIILNDLGRYDEAKEVFNSAQERLNESRKQADPFIEQRISQKHLELGDLYFQIENFEESLEQYQKAKKYLNKPGEIVLRLAQCFAKMNKAHRAVQELQLYLREHPQDVAARVGLGSHLYQNGRVFEAVEEWERVLTRDPHNREAKQFLQLARETRLTEIATPNLPELEY